MLIEQEQPVSKALLLSPMVIKKETKTAHYFMFVCLFQNVVCAASCSYSSQESVTVSSERSVNSKTIQKKFKMGDTTGWGRGESMPVPA